MARFFGKVGFQVYDESTGVFAEDIVERDYRGDITRNVSKWESGENLNDDLNVMNDISIVADPFAYQNFQCIRYVVFMGAKWKVKSVEVSRPRLNLSIGGVYNGANDGCECIC